MRQSAYIFILSMLIAEQAWGFQPRVQKIVPSLFSEFSDYLDTQPKSFENDYKAVSYLQKTFQDWADNSIFVIVHPQDMEVRRIEENGSHTQVFYELRVRSYTHKLIGKVTLNYEDFDPHSQKWLELPPHPDWGHEYLPQTINEKAAEFSQQLKTAGFIYSRVQIEKKKSHGNVVDIWIRIYLGQRYTFKFKGNSVLSSNLLTQEVISRHQPDIDPAGLEKIIKTIYTHYGFIQAQVLSANTHSFPDQRTHHAQIHIEEGPQYQMAAPTLIFRDNKKQSIAYGAYSKFLSQEDTHRFFSDKTITHYMPFFVAFMKDHGFYQTHIVPKDPIIHSDKAWITPVFEISTGPQAILEKVELSNLPPEMAMSPQLEIFDPLKDRPFGKSSTQTALDTLKERIMQWGYLDIQQKITILRNHEQDKPNKVLITLQASHDLGPRYYLKHHEYQNTCETSPWLLDQYFELRDGDPYNPAKIESAIAALYRTELFRSIHTETEDRTYPDRIERSLTFRFSCSVKGSHEFGAGFFSETGFKLFSNFSYRNLWNQNQTLFANTDLNIRLPPYFTYVEPHVGLTLFWPYLLQAPFDSRFTSDFKIADELDLDTTSLVSNFDLEKSFTTWFKLILHVLEFSVEYQHHFVNEPFRSEFTQIEKFGVTTEFSFIDHPQTPSRGHKHIISSRWAIPPLSTTEDVNFLRFESNHAVYLSPFSTDRVVLAGNGILGLIQSIHNYNFIPRSEFFFLGGDASLRGFDARSVGPNTQVNPRTIQSMALVNFRTELRLKMAENFFIFGFWDTGSIWTNYVNLSPFRHSSGGGFRLHTPLGAINLALGFPIDGVGPPPNLIPGRAFDTYKIHLSLSSF